MNKKFIILASALSLSVTLITGCSNTKEEVIKDREGNEVKIPTKIEKIVSTAPSNTEVLVKLGFADKIVATDNYSDDIKELNPDRTKVDFSNPDAEALVALDPDIIIASGHNKSQSAENPFKLIEEAGIPVVYIPSSESIDGIFKDIEFISDVMNVEDKGDKIVEEMKSQIEEVKSIGDTIKDEKSVYFEIGPAPNLFTFGNSTFLNEMIDIVGAKNIFNDQSSWVSPSSESVIDKNPDTILTNVDYVENSIQEIKSRDGWDSINAVKNNEVYKIDSNSSSRGSQNIIKALKQMAEAIYPDNYEY